LWGCSSGLPAQKVPASISRGMGLSRCNSREQNSACALPASSPIARTLWFGNLDVWGWNSRPLGHSGASNGLLVVTLPLYSNHT